MECVCRGAEGLAVCGGNYEMKPVDFATYKRVQKMTYNDFNRWVISVYNSALQNGINITQNDIVAELTEDRLYDLIRSVKGIGENRTIEIVNKILAEGIFDGSKT